MADLLLELFSEEIPARMQQGAARDLERLIVGALSDRGLLFESFKAFAGPRRLTMVITGLPAKQADVREELKGPKVDAPQAAIDGFLKKTGLTKDQLTVEKTPKGDVYMAVIEREGRETSAVLAEILPEAFAKLPWPKSMRWKPNDPVRWVRPLHSILCTFDGEVVPLSFAGIQSSNVTRGHRFLSQGDITVRRYDDYVDALHKAHVILDAEQRKAIIAENVKQAAFVHGLEMIPDEGLLNEVAGLAEWPVVLIGTIEDQFMDVPAEILQTSMRTHQKYFSLRDPKTGKMANRFAVVANMIAEDGGKEIVAGNERVLRARLSDAKFFWDEDRKQTLESRVEALKGIVFHAKLGTQYERIERLSLLAGEIARVLGGDPNKAARAARLAKADLTSGVVGEFPELQGVMGYYYSLHDGESEEVANAVRDHYKPVGPNDELPEGVTSVAVAIADKIDTLVGFWRIDEKPTGSRDPFALRRAALGIIRIILQKNLRLDIEQVIIQSDLLYSMLDQLLADSAISLSLPDRLNLIADRWEEERKKTRQGKRQLKEVAELAQVVFANDAELLDFFLFLIDRISIQFKAAGFRHDILVAAVEEGLEDDLWLFVERVKALQNFLKTEDGANLLAGYKRAANILKAEEKKDNRVFVSEVSEKLLSSPAEKSLYWAIATANPEIASSLEKEDFIAAMRQMALLRVPIDAFFESVKVNADDPKVRQNRLSLLAAFRAALHRVADFSKIEG